jgi:zinc transport system substrate-binding protein
MCATLIRFVRGRRLRARFFVIALFAAGATGNWACLATAETRHEGAKKFVVYVSILPQKYFAQKVGGEKVSVFVMVGPGQSPATYEPTPRQMVGLARADIYFRIGIPFESVWMDRIRAANPNMHIVDARQGIQLRSIEAIDIRDGAGDGDRHAHSDDGLKDPHIWTDPLLAKKMAMTFAQQMIESDPSNRSYYQTRFAALAKELDDVDAEIRNELRPVEPKSFMVFHPSWGYFADRYGLTQVPIESEGKTPGARTLAAAIDIARSKRIRVVVVQEQFRRRDAVTVANAVGAQVITVDPLAGEYTKALRSFAQQLSEAMH